MNTDTILNKNSTSLNIINKSKMPTTLDDFSREEEDDDNNNYDNKEALEEKLKYNTIIRLLDEIYKNNKNSCCYCICLCCKK